MKKCPFCAEEIQEEAVKCRYCGLEIALHNPRQKNTSPVAWVGCALFALIFVIIAAYLLTHSKIDEGNNQPKTNSNILIKPLGEPFKLGKFTYSIDKIESRKNIGGYTPYKSQTGASLIIVRYTITNDGKKTEQVLTDDFKITDSMGRSFSTSSEAGTAYAFSSNDKDIILSEIQPGLKKKMVSVYEIPDESIKNKGLKLVVPEKGWGTREVRIAIDIK